MMAVIFNPADGRVIQRVQGSPAVVSATATAMSGDFLPVSDDQPYEATHRVQNGKLVPMVTA